MSFFVFCPRIFRGSHMICQKSTFSWYILVVFIGQLTSPVVMVLWWPVVLLQRHTMLGGWLILPLEFFGHPIRRTPGGCHYFSLFSFMWFSNDHEKHFLYVRESGSLSSEKFADFIFFTFLAAWPRLWKVRWSYAPSFCSAV